jgi:PASTA domain
VRSRRSTLLLRLAAMVVLAIPATATITFAASKKLDAAKKPIAKPEVTATRAPLVVPDVRGQAYVFAKGILEDGGFSWRVSTRNGYSANTVVSQAPAPGTRVVDTGAPTVTLELTKNGHYAQKGTPENASPFAGTPLRFPRHSGAKHSVDLLAK